MMESTKPECEIEITVNRGKQDERRLTFSDSFRMGRAKSCEVEIPASVVSGHHVEVVYESGRWWIHDLHSTNGTYLDGELIGKKLLADRATIQLGKGGPIVSLKTKGPTSPQESHFGHTVFGTIFKAVPSATQLLQRYFTSSVSKSAGQYTIFLRHAFNQALKKRGRIFIWAISILSVITATVTTIAWWQHERLTKLQPLGAEIFYNMKRLELQIAQLTNTIGNAPDPKLAQQVRALQDRYRQLQHQYDDFVEQLGVYDESVDTQERLIMRVARIFGECELRAPDDFVDEVKRYIRKWQASSRLPIAVGRSLAYGYPKTIAESFLAHNLPPQFIYLALQESDFDVNRTGPKTKYGIAKGMWQFIPRTAIAYGLKVGPLSGVQRPDPKDERHNFEKSTKAAAKLIRDLYDTEAQGSGLLVLASYNWGIGNVQELIEQMPSDPRERNFWNLVKKHNIPKQTYDFVFYVLSAAAIGENPALFGFKFKNLLEEVS